MKLKAVVALLGKSNALLKVNSTSSLDIGCRMIVLTPRRPSQGLGTSYDDLGWKVIGELHFRAMRW
jgi:hypothetical protein